VHRTEAPMSRYISRSTIYSVPAQDTPIQTLVYFTDPRAFGKGYPEMRTAMGESIAAFREEGYSNLPELPGDLGLTAQFISVASPAQAILAGTSSFRLDKLASYLSPEGVRLYFHERLATVPSEHDTRRFADTLLQEALGVYRPPVNNWEGYEEYITAAFCIPENRVTADRIYLSLVQEIAKLWGTLLAVRGYSRGESFVARNVGLKSCWVCGKWEVRIIFMDHDALTLPGPHTTDVDVFEAIPNFALDETYIWNDESAEQFAISELFYLKKIYRVGDDVRKAAESLAQMALKEAYGKTQHALLTNQKLQAMFGKSFIKSLLGFDVLANRYLRNAGSATQDPGWKEEVEKILAEKGCTKNVFARYLQLMERNKAFLERNGFLFDLVNERAVSQS
jgi:hypothetical protein